MAIEEIVKLLSAFGIGTIVSAAFVFMQSSKRNQLDYITKERSEWRKDVKKIIVCLLSEDKDKQTLAINKLKTQLNPYGFEPNFKFSSEYYMKDGHIWDLIYDFDFTTEKIFKLERYLELLLKYDWERTKQEVSNKIPSLFYSFIRFFSIIFLLITFFTSTFKSESFAFSILISCDWAAIVFLSLQDFIEDTWTIEANINLPKRLLWAIIAYALPLLYVIVKLNYILSDSFPWDERLIFLIITILVLSGLYALAKQKYEKEYVSKLKLIDFENPEIIKQTNELYNEINYLQNKLHRLDYEINGYCQ